MVVLILIIIAVDDRVYISGTAADGTAVNPKYTFSQIRTGDWIIHGLPLLEVLILMLFDYQLYFRGLVYHWERSDHWTRRWWYWVWFYTAPLYLLILYAIIFDTRDKYTDKLSRAAGFAITFGISAVVMTVYALSVRVSETESVRLPDFYPSYLHAPPVKREQRR